MSKVTQLPPIKGEKEQVLEAITKLMSEPEFEHMTEAAFVVSGKGGDIGHLTYFHKDEANYFRLVGALEAAKYTVLRSSEGNGG